MSQRPVLTEEDRVKSYAKYYDLAITAITSEKIAILEGKPFEPKDILLIERRNDMFQPGYLPGDFVFIAVITKMI